MGGIPPGLYGGRMDGVHERHNMYNEDGTIKPYRRNATHVAIAYYISTNRQVADQ